MIYYLYGIVVHSGSLNSGHYISYVKHNTQWYQISDS
jgi:ubiquitin C-terminal hydrolase